MLILQWNLNGFNARKERLQLLITKYQPDIICLQETNFKNQYCASLKGYTTLNKNRANALHASGGVATYTKNGVSSQSEPLDTNLEAVATTIKTPEKISICNLYLPGSIQINKKDIIKITEQLPTPNIILGDLNGHNYLWHSKSINDRGRVIEDWLSENDTIVLLNNGQPTHFSAASGNQSIIDLTFASANIATKIEWNALEDLHDSDHYPILISIQNQQTNSPEAYLKRWKVKKANWTQYRNAILAEISRLEAPTNNTNLNIDTILTDFNNLITQAANESIPQTNGKQPKKQVPWWNPDCDKTLKESKKAYRSYKKFPSEENKIKYKKLRAKARQTLKQSKKNLLGKLRLNN